MEPSLRRLEPFRRAISINRKSTRRAYTRIHELVAYNLIHSQWGERKRDKETRGRRGRMGKRDVCSTEIFLAPNDELYYFR